MADQLVPSSSFSSTPSWEYDVFLSFRGTDTRTNFTNHLYHALVRHGIRTFLDDSELPRGEEISPTLLKAIENSRISIIVFSENYASSRWCLDELVHILECRESRRQMTWPIFYKVDPSDVRHQKNSYGVAFAVPSRKYENDPEKVQRWRTALTKAANLKGDTLNEKEYEPTFIDRIVEEISNQVSNRTCLNVARYPVGIESCAKEVEELLGVGGNDRRVVGIWGASGIGKTTIAKAVYDAIAHEFEGSCFLADVRETLTSHEGVIKLQNTLLSKVLRGTKLKIDEVHHGISLIKNRLRQKKILLILDDVDKLEQLKDWVDADCFGEGSRVIVTTKDRSLLDFYGGQRIYEVQKLGDDKALELFSWNAFESNRPPDDYLSLARRAIAYAQGLPLALNIIGSHLRNKCIARWQAILDGYDSYDGEPYTIIEKILRKTYDAWDYGLQQVFLDIACFFKGENKGYVLQILRSSTLNVRQDCIEVLVEKAIITIERDRILMHDLLEKMGKHIVYKESPNEPGKRSRLWHHEDVRNVLIDSRGTKKIRGIVVNMPEPDVIPLNPKSFLKMVNLEYFINRNAYFSGCVNYLPNSLRLIEFGGRSNIYQKHTYELNLPSNFHPRDLVSFDVSYSGIKQLKGFKNLDKLTWMNLSGCEFLKKIPDLSGSPNIKHLDLRGCENLREVDDYVGFLDKLVELDLSWCSNLTRFATRLGLRSLEKLYLNRCTRLERFPEIEKDKMKSLTHLWIGESGIRELPSSIAYLTGLQELDANGCELRNVPDLSGCPNLEHLNLRNCTSLVEVHDSVGFLDKLTCLYLDGCSKLTKFATRLGLRSLYYLSLNGCKRLESFPEIEGKMESLDHLEIVNSGIRELPSIACFTRLRILRANSCENIQPLGFGKKVKFDEASSCSTNLRLWFELQGCNLSESNFLVPLDWCSAVTNLDLSRNNFVSLPDCISKVVNLETLFLRDCKRLQEIPVLPPKLWKLDLDGCTSLEKIPKLPPKLTYLNLCNCSELSSDEAAKFGNNLLNEEIDPHSQLNISSALKRLNMSENNFVSLPDCLSKAVNLEELLLMGCKRLREIPILPPKLKELYLDDCTSLEKIPKLPLKLELLSLCNCSGLSGDEVAKLENNLLNEELYPRAQLSIIYPGNEISKWFSYTSNHPTTIQPLPDYIWDEDEWDEDESEEEFVRGSEFHFEIPLKLQVGETLLGLALSFVVEPSTHHDSDLEPWIFIEGKGTLEYNLWHNEDIKATHVRLVLVGLGEQEQRGDICQVVFGFPNGCPIKSCGVHCLLRNQDELLHLSLRPTSSLGKRPRPCGSSYSEDEEDEEQEQEQPSDSDIEEDEDPMQRAQFQQQQQQQQQQQLRQEQFQQPMQPVSSIKRPYDGGVCDHRLMQYLDHQRQRSAVNQLVQVAQKCQSTIADSGSDGISQQDLQTNSNMVPTAGRQLAKSLELQISEVVNSCRENKVGPIEALKVYPRHAAANIDNSTGGGGNNTYNQRAPDLPSNLHLQEDGFFNSNPDDNMNPQISSDIVLRPTSSLGKRPHPRGSSDIVDDEYDHPKRRQIDIEEEEEQEQPSASDDPQFQIS